jgi:hypothetical protein
MLYKGRDQMEIESGNIHAPRKSNDNTHRKTSRVEILDNKDEQLQKDESKYESDDSGASSKFGATGWNNKKALIGATISSIRRTAHVNTETHKQHDYNLRAQAEIDTCVDTLCAGSTFILFETIGKVVDVSGFHDSNEAIKNIPVGTCITKINLEDETIFASFPQSLYFGDTMKTSLIPPAQLWDFGITDDVVPKQYSDGKSLHGIHHPDSNVFIPFHLYGCISYFLTPLPSDKEINQCWWITFTSDAEWQPYSDHFSKAEKAAKITFDIQIQRTYTSITMVNNLKAG